MSMAGWPVFKEAKALRDSGKVREASYEPPTLKGKIDDGSRGLSAGLRIKNAIDVENLCSCRDARVRGIICAHSIAVALQIIDPKQARVEREEASPPSSRRPEATTQEKPGVRLEIEGSLRHLEANLHFTYTLSGANNPEAEQKAILQLVTCGFVEERGKPVLKGEESIIKFFATTLPELQKCWEVRVGERFSHVTQDIIKIEPQFTVREREDGWLDFHVHYQAGKEAVFSAGDIAQLLRSGQSHAKLKNGKVAALNTDLATDLEEVLRDCNPRQERGRYVVPAAFRGYLEGSLQRWRGEKFSQETADYPTLGSLEKQLRSYQVTGARWLLHQAQRSGGGLLADEMGLGKTVQTLAMLQQLGGPALVVCPSSLVWNWQREARQFVPSMKVLPLDGSGRSTRFAEIAQHDLIITSYALLRRDIDHYRGLEFSAVILDEAQHIKNPESQNAKAAFRIQAKSRFILTGTPVENSVRDLWSLFEFLHPSYLGNRTDFRERYEVPLNNGDRADVWDRLNRRIRPYLLRRTKSEVIRDLPEKIEQTIEVELTDAQKIAYTELQQAARQQVDSLLEHSSASAVRMQVLTALLRLRQACCDLRLLKPTATAEDASAKVSACLELLAEAMDGGHRVLLFSQFTSMLDLLQQALAEKEIACCRLDGATKQRQAVVERFQENADIPVFLISLKAGGVGLNLTAADTVIHFDPWWNPAVENQATDRAHRIGQKNVVTSIKLIAKDTVEERVLRMQQKKRELFAGIMAEEAALQKMTTEDLRELIG